MVLVADSRDKSSGQKAIGAELCVEGIETQAQLDALKGMGVKYVQGFYYDKPLRRAAFEEKYIYS